MHKCIKRAQMHEKNALSIKIDKKKMRLRTHFKIHKNYQNCFQLDLNKVQWFICKI